MNNRFPHWLQACSRKKKKNVCIPAIVHAVFSIQTVKFLHASSM